MERRSSKQSECSTKEGTQRGTTCNETKRSSISAKLDQAKRIGSLLRDADPEEDPIEQILRKGLKKDQALKLNVNVLEDGVFEEPKLDLTEKPVITFNHVCTVTESEQISFESIRKASSRSPSPLLEVPAFKVGSKQAIRPPL